MSKKNEAPEGADKKGQPMDPSAVEALAPVVTLPGVRNCWAIETLVDEVRSKFNDVPVEYSGANGRRTNLDVSFDLTVLDTEDRTALIETLTLLNDPAFSDDRRIADVLVEDEVVLVSMKNDPRTMDNRTPFGVDVVLWALAEDDDAKGSW